MPRQPQDPKTEQHHGFVETTRRLDCDEEKERFEKWIAKTKPKSGPKQG